MEPAGGDRGRDRDRLRARSARPSSARARRRGGDGVLVLMDLGSAVQTAQMVLELGELRRAPRSGSSPRRSWRARSRRRISAGGGGVARRGRDRGAGALRSKQAELGVDEPQRRRRAQVDGRPGRRGGPELPVRNRARAARAARRRSSSRSRRGHDAELLLSNATTGAGPASARSLTEIALLGVRGGHALRVQARGPAADAVAGGGPRAGRHGLRRWDRRHGRAGRGRRRPPRASRARRAAGCRDRCCRASPPPPASATARCAASAARPRSRTADADDPEAEAARLEEALGHGARGARAAARADLEARGRADEAAIFEAQAALLGDEALLGPARSRRRRPAATPRAPSTTRPQDVAARYESARRRLPARARRRRPRRRPPRRSRRCSARATLGDGATAPGSLVDRRAAAGRRRDARPRARRRRRDRARRRDRPRGDHRPLARRPDRRRPRRGAARGPGRDAPPARRRRAAPCSSTPTRRPPSATRPTPPPRRRATRPRASRGERARDHAATARASRSSRTSATSAAPPRAVELGAEGVGLLRTEFLFLDRAELPGEDEQVEAYSAVARGLGGRPLIIRTLDVGADKPLPSMPKEPEANPFLGRRGMRLQLARPRAADRAAAGGPAHRRRAPGEGHVPDGRDDRRGPRGARGARRGPHDARHRPAARGRRHGRGAGRRRAGRALRARAGLLLDRHERPRAVHDGRRARQRARRGASPPGPVPAVLQLVDRDGPGRGRATVAGSACAASSPATWTVRDFWSASGYESSSMAPPRIADVKAALRTLDLGEAREAACAPCDAETPDEARAIASQLFT